MSSDDLQFLDVLSSVPTDIKRYSADVADYIDAHLNKVSDAIRHTLWYSKWIPDSARPRFSKPPRSSYTPQAPVPAFTKVCKWVLKNKILATVIIFSVGGATYHLMRNSSRRRKRRAKRAGNGARLEVIVIVGQPSEPYTRSISLDLERRGFIVYVVCNSTEEEGLVQNQCRADIRPFPVDIVDPHSARASIDRLAAHFQMPHTAFPGAKPHYYTFRSLIIIPNSDFPVSPLATLAPSTLSDLLNTRLLHPILTVQIFLPLLQILPISCPRSSRKDDKPSVLVLTPTIVSSINPAFHLPEATITSGLSAFITVLQQELAPMDIPVSHIQLGTFDVTGFTHKRQLTIQSQRAETLRWDDNTRNSYARNFTVSTAGTWGKGSSLQELNNAVFDVIVSRRSQVVKVGMGSSLYGWVGKWVPAGIIGWMLGLRAVRNEINVRESGKGSRQSNSPESNCSEKVAGQRSLAKERNDAETEVDWDTRSAEYQIC